MGDPEDGGEVMTDCTNNAVNCRKGGRNATPVHLDADTERQLREIVESPIWANWQTRRAEVILGMANGAAVKELMEKLGISRSSIQRICRMFEKDGIMGLITRQSRTGRPRSALYHSRR